MKQVTTMAHRTFAFGLAAAPLLAGAGHVLARLPAGIAMWGRMGG